MKIIKNGKLNKQITCTYCGCVFEYEGKDVKVEYDYATALTLSTFPSKYNERKYVNCPQCNEVHYLTKVVEATEDDK